MAIPDFRTDGWLPNGHHQTTWEEIEEVFKGDVNSHRRELMTKLLSWKDKLRNKNINGRIILDGSFISNEENPGDFDLILLYDENSEQVIENDNTAKQLINMQYCDDVLGFHIFLFSERTATAFPQWTHLDVFDVDTRSNITKGVVEVEL